MDCGLLQVALEPIDPGVKDRHTKYCTMTLTLENRTKLTLERSFLPYFNQAQGIS